MASLTKLVSKILSSKSLIPVSFRRVFSSLQLTPRAQWQLQAHHSSLQKRLLQQETIAKPAADSTSSSQLFALPKSCPGCGAFSQTISPDTAGFYNINRKTVKAFVGQQGRNFREGHERKAFEQSLGFANQALGQDWDLKGGCGLSVSTREKPVSMPICDRCHDLLHHHTGVSIIHPTLQSIQDIISESPYKYNHIYHVLDAADFPLSVIPQLHQHLSLTPQRSLNRRAKTHKFYHGRQAELSFVITRSDLLAPKKEQVDAMMPYLVQVLRDALGPSARDVRLGNVCCVSSKRGWWTRNLKEEIWNRGGGGWMVGKVNVGKSSLFECVFPKGRNEELDTGSLRDAEGQSENGSHDMLNQVGNRSEKLGIRALQGSMGLPNLDQHYLQEDSMLPPAPQEQPFPIMPVVSSMPGTTASPIRHLFGGGKGELIDLPGLARGNLDDYVADKNKLDLVMQHRPKPEQFVLKPGQSLLLGRLIRITPKTTGVTVLAYPFLPLEGHVTSTKKAIAIHTEQRSSGVPSITKPGVGTNMLSAGTFQLNGDVTRKRAGPLTSPTAIGLNPKILSFVVFSTDILIEGCGWVELVAQVRKGQTGDAENEGEDVNSTEAFPTVEVFSPEGKHIGARQTMNAWLHGGRRSVPYSKRMVRPRRSMKGVKKSLKLARRQKENSSGS